MIERARLRRDASLLFLPKGYGLSMKTSIEISDKLLTDAVELTGISDTAKLATMAIEEFIRGAAIEQLGGALPGLREKINRLEDLRRHMATEAP